MHLRAFARYLKSLLSFGAIQAMQILTPLIALPWLARILEPASFGLLMYFCLLPPLVAIVVDCGMLLAGAREAAYLRGKKAALSALFGSVLTSKLILCLLLGMASPLLFHCLPFATNYPLAFTFAVLAGVGRGINPVWFFQGIARYMPIIALLDIGASLITLGCTFYFVQAASDWLLYLFFLAASRLFIYSGIICWLCIKLRPSIQFKNGFSLIFKSFPLFGSSFCQMVCYNGSQLVLGFWLPPASLGALAACIKMIRALAGLVQPFTQTIFPEACILFRENPERNRQLLHQSLKITFLCAIVLTSIAWLAAPIIADLALGGLYDNASDVLRITILALPFMAASNVLAIQIMVPGRKERSQFYVIAWAALASLPLAALFGSYWGLKGGAFLTPLLECCVATAYLLTVKRSSLL